MSSIGTRNPNSTSSDRYPSGSRTRPSAVTDPNGPAPPRRSTSARRNATAVPNATAAGHMVLANQSDVSSNVSSMLKGPGAVRAHATSSSLSRNDHTLPQAPPRPPRAAHVPALINLSAADRVPANAQYSPTAPNALYRSPLHGSAPQVPTSPTAFGFQGTQTPNRSAPAFAAHHGSQAGSSVTYYGTQSSQVAFHAGHYGSQVGHDDNDGQRPLRSAAVNTRPPFPPSQPVQDSAQEDIADPYDILSDYARDTSSDADSDRFGPAAGPSSHVHHHHRDGHESSTTPYPSGQAPAPRGQQPAPWAFKPRPANKPAKSAVEAANSAQAPNALGLKHEETSSPNAFVVDEDFERIVQEIVPNFDHPETPSLTFRVFFLGMLFNIILAFANTIFSFRTNYFILSAYVGILLAYPMGKFLEHYVPDHTLYTRWFKLSLNPGPFTVKEHVLIGIWATTGASGAYGTSNIVVQELFYDLKLSHITSIAFLVCLNLIGFGFSGLFRSWVIRPPEMTWPTVLPFVSLYSAFHGGLRRDAHSDSDSVIDPKHASKLRFFFIAIAVCFVYHMVGTQYMAPALMSVPLLCFFVPSSSFFWRFVVGSHSSGAGAFAVTLDYSMVGSLSQTVPFWTTLSQTLGTVVLQWIVAPLASYQNWFGAPDEPRYRINSSFIFDKNGDALNKKTNQIISRSDVDGIRLNAAKYEELRPFHMSPLFSMAYFSSMAQFTSAFMHCIVWYGSSIWRRFRGVNKNKEGLDIHCLLIDQYDEVPLAVYLALLACITVATVVVCQLSAMAMPWYMTLLSIGFSAIACFPIAIILATTGVQLYLNVVSQFLLGLIMPGFPIVQMAFKSLAVSVGQQCMFLLTDLKLGHYMKIPPRHVFITQITASIVSALVSYAATVFWLSAPEHRAWIVSPNKLGESDPGKAWESVGNRIFYSASVIWGLIGPRRFFFETAYGAVIVWGLVIGAMTPMLIKMLDMLSGKHIPWKYVQGPLLFNGVSPGSDQNYVFTGFLLALFFQFFMYRYRTNWWKRYNYILACALDVGVAIAAFVATFGLQGWGLSFPEWLLNPGNDAELGKRTDFCYVDEAVIPPGVKRS